MKLSSFLVALSVFGRSVLSRPFDLPTDLAPEELEAHSKRSSDIVYTTGVSGAVHPRYEIRQMQAQQPNQFTLLILTLKNWYLHSSSNPTSYHAIAGIHGVPNVNYNNVEACSSCAGANGYCTHDMVIFPTFHRAYVAHFEQEFVALAKRIANSWSGSGGPTKAEMQEAASTIRWPFWDWAAAPPNNGNNLPDAVSSSTIQINGPNGQETVSNPLYSYKFEVTDNLRYTPFISWPNTLRWPTSDAASATSNEQGCINGLNNVRASLQDQVYKLLTACTEYLHFSNDHSGTSTPDDCANSIEGIHNTIHTTSGGQPTPQVKTVGHMAYLPEAAFDALFFLHHANVDRIFAMWQTLNPSSYGAAQTAVHDTWTVPKGASLTPEYPLAPFYQTGSTFWTTETVKDWTQFGYTYPEFVDSDGSSGAIASYVNKLYGPSATATAGSSKRTAEPEPVDMEKRGIFPGPKGAFASNGSTYEYVANIVTPRYALGGSYNILMFLGAPASEDPASWLGDSNFVGPMGVLAGPSMANDFLISGSIPLTRALTAKLGSGALAELTEELVGPYLQNLLEWRIIGPDGETVEPSSLNGFLVSVFSSTATNPASANVLPEYSNFIPLPVATHGKSGGLLGAVGSLTGGLTGGSTSGSTGSLTSGLTSGLTGSL